MADISKNKKQNQRTSGTATAFEALPANQARGPYGVRSGTGTPSMKPVGDPPGSDSYFGRPEPQADAPSYFGQSQPSAAHLHGPSVVGEPPGSDAYFGRASRPGTGTRAGGPVSFAQRVPAPTANPVNVGHAPGSAAYYGDARGRSYGDTTTAPTRHSAAHSAGAPTARPARTLSAVGTPPGTSAYYGSK